MDTYKASSYSGGRILRSVTFQAASPEMAMTHPAIDRLPRGVKERGRMIRVVAVKRMDPA